MLSGTRGGGALIRGRGMNGLHHQAERGKRALDSLRGLGVLLLTGHEEEEMIITPEVELVVFRQSEIRIGSG